MSTTGIDDVIITGELDRRPSRPPEYEAENRALILLAEAMANDPGNVLSQLVELAKELTKSDSAGISLLEPGREQGIFRWVATAGAWTTYRDGTMPREESPCGEVISRESVLLMKNPERVFPALLQADPGIGEGLLAPFSIGGKPVGTVWTIRHEPDAHFEAEDARLLQSLAGFASAAHQMIRAEENRLTSHAHLEALTRASSDVFFVMSSDMRELRELSGGDFIADTKTPSREWLRDYIPPEDHAHAVAAIDEAIRTKGVFNHEHRVLQLNGEIGWAASRAVPILDADGAIIEWFGSASDITARKRAEAGLRESEERLGRAFDAAGMGAWELDLGTHEAWRSERHDRIFGYETIQPKWTYEVFLDHVLAEDRSEVDRRFREAVAGQGSWGFECRIRRIDDEVRWIWAQGIIEVRHEGRSVRMKGMVRDITDQKVAELALRDSEGRQAFLLRLSDALRPLADHQAIVAEATRLLGEHMQGDRCFIAEIEPDGVNLDVHAEQIRPGVKSVIGHHNFDSFGVFVSPILVRGETLAVGDIATLDLTPAEREHYALVGIAAYLLVPLVRDGRLAACLTVNHQTARPWSETDKDIARQVADRTWAAVERARAERSERDALAELEQLTQKFDATLSTVPDSIFNFDRNGRFLYANRNLLDTWGLQPGEEVGKNLAELNYTPDLQETLLGYIRRVFETGETVHDETPYTAPDGTVAHYDYLISPAFGPDGAVEYVVGSSRDITERKQAEMRLRENEERQAFLLKLSDALRPLADSVEIKTEAMRVLGEYLGVGAVQYFEVDAEGYADTAPGYADSFLPLQGRFRIDDFGVFWAKHYRVGSTLAVPDVRIDPRVGADGLAACEALNIRAVLGVPLLKEGRLALIVGVFSSAAREWSRQDIALTQETAERTWAAAERSQAETALRESEVRFRHIVENARDYAIFTTDSDRIVNDWHEGAEAVFGYTAAEIVGRDAKVLFTPEDRAAGEVEQEVEIARVEGSAPNVRWHVRKDGGRIFVEGRTIALRNGGGQLRGFLKVGQDVTARRQIEQALHTSEERFRQFAENSADVLWIADATAEPLRLEYLSPAFDRIWGAPREDLMGDISRFAGFLHPDDSARVSQAMPRLLAGEANAQEYRIVRPDNGEERWIFDTGFPVRDVGGAIIRVAGIAQDITDRKRAEEALRESRRQWRTLVEGVPQLVWRAAIGGEWIWASRQWTAFTGQTEEESSGFGWLKMVHPDDQEIALEAWDLAQDSGSFQMTGRLQRRDGAFRWYQTRATPERDEGGGVVEWLGTCTDIDDLQRLQDQQSVLVAELQHRTRNLLAVVRSIGAQTLATSTSLEDFRTRFNDRLNALSRVQGLLSRSEHEPITIGALVRTELDALGAAVSHERIRIEGPDVQLRNSTVQTLSLALHELATNARKYGALSNGEGTLSVDWFVEEKDQGPVLRISWIEETIVHRGKEQMREGGGYGRKLIERALPYSLNAQTNYVLDDQGVRCRISLPLRVDRNGAE